MKPNAAARHLASKILAGLVLANAVGAAVPGPSAKVVEGECLWIHIATEGLYKGHPSSPEGANFTPELFAKLIENFRSHPAFKAGSDGLGTQPVVPYDFEHASEWGAPNEGSVPQHGTPAPAWILDLKTKKGEDGKLELWAWSDVTSAEARDVINAKGYRWTSVAIWGNATDPVTGAKIGPVLSSCALTNKPFLQHLTPIVASMSQWGRAESAEEALVGMREVFGLSADSTIEQVSAELDLFAEMLAAGTLSESVRDMDLVSRIRSLLGLRVLSTVDEVLEAARQMLAGTGYTEEVNGAKPNREPNKDQEPPTMSLSTKLAAILKCRDTDDSILCAAEETTKAAAGASDALKQLQDMFGSKDLQSLVKAASEQIALAKKAEGLVAALQAANDSMGAGMEAEAEAETDAVVATITADKTVASRIRPAILSQRKGCVTEQDVFGTKVRKLDDEKIKAFRTLYPLPPAELEALTKRIFAAPGGQQITFRADDKGNLQQTTVAPDERNPSGEDRRAKVRTLAGRNDTERAMTLLSKERAGFDRLDRLDQVEQAGRWLRGEDQ